MTLQEKIVQQVHSLPESAKLEVLEFLECLHSKSRQQEDEEWSRLSLDHALRGMEDEPDLYSLEDLREVF